MLTLLSTLALGGVLPDPDGLLPPFVTPGADGRMAATLRASHLTEAQQRALAHLGVGLRTDGDRLVHLGGHFVVDGTLRDLRAARDRGFDIDLARRLDVTPPPITETGTQVEAYPLWAAGLTPADGFTGEGMTILDIDSGIDVFHPHFFRADAGTYPWLDVDGNGVLDPGTDGIDLDGNGTLAANEVLHLIPATAFHYDWDAYDWLYVYDSGLLDPSRDWLYLDTNFDGARNRGAAEGFTEGDPGYGEPVFVPDDADGSFAIEGAERLLQLGSSVVVAVNTEERIYERGTDLIEYEIDQDDADHGAAVTGILAGGQLPRQRETHGLAPGAELLFAESSFTDAELAGVLMWAEGLGVDVVLHEYAPWVGFALDGTSAVEAMVDEQQARGITHVCPAGNLADAGKHAVSVAADGAIDYAFEVPEGEDFGYPWQYLWVEVHGDADTPEASSCTFTAPSGATYTANLQEFGTPVGEGHSLWSSHTVTPRGRPWVTLNLWRSPDALEAGTWQLTCDVVGGATWHAFLYDYYSGWSRGVTFVDEVREATMGVPSTSDSCLAIGAVAGRWADTAVSVGDLRTWSSRGPTVDGRRAIDLVAPDDPFAPHPSYPIAGWEGLYSAFGGTSGASPHVAATAALIMQAEPDLTGLQVRERLMDHAEAMAGEASEVGAGQLRAYQAWAASEPAAPPPDAQLMLEVHYLGSGDQCTARLAATDPSLPGLVLSYDLDYDGTYEAEGPDVDVTARLDEGPFAVRIEASLGGWRVGGLAAEVEVRAEACPPPPVEPDDTDEADTVPSFAQQAAPTEAKACGCEGGVPLLGWGLLLPVLALRRRR